MRIIVEYVAWIGTMIGRKEDTLEVDGNETLEHILQRLARKYGPRFDKGVYSEERGLKPYVQILVDGRGITREELKSNLGEVDRITIVPVVGGG